MTGAKQRMDSRRENQLDLMTEYAYEVRGVKNDSLKEKKKQNDSLVSGLGEE